eukprot:Sspe_Gene.19589::Locus_7145_Transcript_3_4_Confidence_0.333_Length_4077::g.19589::m.19589/K14802/DRS2, ATP8A; phospholipid-transporting ATPase
MEKESELPLIPSDEDIKKSQDESSSTMRKFAINNYDANSKLFCNNEVITSKYTFVPFSLRFFLFRNLFEQFQRYANLYFLIIAILQLIPGLSPTGRYTTALPLGLVLLITLLKDLWEDWQRRKSDNTVNYKHKTLVYRQKWEEISWRDVVVGDIVEVKKDEEFPADLLLLYTTEAKGTCYIETSNLDGETNLKMKKAHVEPAAAANPMPAFDPSAPGKYTGEIFCQPPDDDMYRFEGFLQRTDTGSKRITRAPIDVNSVLLRGAKLGGSTKSIMGAVIYTGRETKLMKNQTDKSVHKISQLERLTNKQISYIFGAQIVICFFSALGLGVNTRSFYDHWYLAYEEGQVPWLAGLLGFVTFLILFNNLVPISLYVSMEIVKVGQKLVMQWDREMYYDAENIPTAGNTSSLNEELGQVQYIFSDKTGTLTCNIMDFLKFSVGENAYGTGTTEIGMAAAAREGRTLENDRPSGIKLVKGFYFYDERISDVEGTGKLWNWMTQPNAEEIGAFLRILAVCHTVVAENSNGMPPKYQAQSPDEECLVKGARYLGVEFVDRTLTDIYISVKQKNGEAVREQWKLQQTLAFTSDRKRMSVIVRNPKGNLQLLCKGADTVIYERLRKNPNATERQAQETSKKFLTQFAKDGLRTLVVAKADLDEKEYTKWEAKFKKASENVGDRERMLAEVAEEIEQDLEIVGTTAIEDKLQHGVPATVELLRTAGINVWVLTGDKQETAINIGFACALLHNDMGLFTFHDTCTEATITQTLQNYARDAESVKRDYGQELGIVVQGSTLKLIIGDSSRPENSLHFLGIAKYCKAVICCRVTPGQKAQIVKLVKDNLEDVVTLAVGDGANDVSMIKEAHVGVGISGLEGKQASRNADYSIGQFRFLQRLLLVHGRRSYRRNSKLILYSFYKNICLYLTQFWFCIFNSFTGQSMYDKWAISCYNILFTSMPIIFVAYFDRDVEPKRLVGWEDPPPGCPGIEQFPELYDDGRKYKLFNTAVFWKYTLNAIWHSVVCFFIPLLSMRETGNPDNGWEYGLAEQGVTGFTAVVFVATLKCGLETSSWTVYNVAVSVVSILLWFVYLFIYSGLLAVTMNSLKDSPWWLVYNIFASAQPWLVVVLCVLVALARDFLWKAYKRNFSPNLVHIIMQWEKRKDWKEFNRHLLKSEAPKLFPRQMVKSYKKQSHAIRDRSGADVEMSPIKSQQHYAGNLDNHTGYAFSQEQQQLEYIANMHLTAAWAQNNTTGSPSGSPIHLGSPGSPASNTPLKTSPRFNSPASPLRDPSYQNSLGGFHGSPNSSLVASPLQPRYHSSGYTESPMR